jgi:PAS domain S-box-containing protein
MSMPTGHEPTTDEPAPTAPGLPNEASFHELFESLPIGVYRATGDGHVLFANPFLARLLGYRSVDALLASSFVVDHLHDDPAGFRQQLTNEGAIRGVESAFIRDDGTRIWLRVNARAVFREDRTLDLIEGTVEDISERKQAERALRASEERYRVLAEIASHYTYVYRVTSDGQFICEWIGGNYAGMTGYTPDEVDARGGWNVLHHPDDVGVGHERDERIRRGEPSVTEFRIRRRDGEWRWLHNIVHPVRDPRTGAVIRFYGATVDITDRKRVEEELRGAKESAEAANRARNDFLAHVGHEIRTPLQALFSTLQLLLAADPTEVQRQYVNIARRSAQDLLTLLNKLVDFARVESGKVELESARFSLRGLLDEAVRALEARARVKGLQLVQHVADGVPDPVCGDPTRLQQVLVNLIDNAIKFTREGQVAVCVEPLGDEARSSSQVMLRFEVRDTGIGIAPERQARIFEPFVQADPSMARIYGGTGLGLSIASRLVEMMGGWLSVASEPGTGSTFSFTAQFGLPDAGS